MSRGVLLLLIVAVVLLLAVLTLPFLIDANQFRPAIEAGLTKSLGRDVKIGDLKLGILSGTVTASDLSVADDPSFNQTPFLRTKAMALSIDAWQAVFSRKLNVNGMTIDAPEVVLIQAPSGQWNFSSLGTKSSAHASNGNLALSIKSMKINNARLSLTQGSGKPQILDDVSVEVKDFAPGAVFPFSLSAKIAGGGDVAMEGKTGPIDPMDAATTPLTASLKLTNVDLAASGAVGVVGIIGVIWMDGTLTSNGHTVDLAGKLKAEKLKLAAGATAARKPLLVDFSLIEDLKQHSGQITRGDAAIGTVKTSLTGMWAQHGELPVLNMNLSAQSVPVAGLEELLPVLDVVLPSGSTLEGGTATARLALSGTPTALVITGPVSVQNTRLKGFDLGSRMSPIEKLAGLKSGPNTEIQTLSANLRIAPEGTSLQNIHVVVPALGEVNGGGTISPRHALDFRMRATVHPAILASVFTPSKIQFLISGTSSDPQFHADVAQIASEELVRGLKGAKVGGVDAGQAADTLPQGLFGGRKKK